MIIPRQKKRNLAMLLVMVMLFGLLPMTSPLVAEAAGSDKGPYITVTGKVYGEEGYTDGDVTKTVYTGEKLIIQSGLTFTVSEAVYLNTEKVDEKDKAEVKIDGNTVTGIVYTNNKITVTGDSGAGVKITLTSVENNVTSTFTFIIGKEDLETPEVEAPRIEVVPNTTTRNSVTLAVYSNVDKATFKFFANGQEATAAKVNGKDNQYNITGLAAGTTYNITAIAIDANGFESAPSNPVTVITNKKSSGSSSSGGSSSSSSSSTDKVTYNKSATIKSRGVTIEFPANALNQDFEVEITRVSSTSRLPMPSNMKFAGDVFEITKDVDGDFDKDVTITLPYDKSKVDFDKYDVSLFWLNEKTDKWVELDDIRVNKSSETVRGEVDHFTKFAVLAIEKGTEIEKDDEVEEIVLSLKDIKGHWAETHITKLIENGAISGYPDGTFKPDNNITRAEFATVLVKALDLEETTGKVFNDTANHWARKYIATAEANGIVSGYSTTTFGADDLITREQMAVMIVKASRLSNTTAYTEFADATKISSWAKPAVDTASYNDIIKGYPDGTFGPQKSATRAEAVTVIGKVL